MAKWINFPVVGGMNADGSTLSPELDGDNLLLADSIISIACTVAAGGEMQAVLTLVDSKTCTLLIGTSPAADAAGAPDANAPASTGYVNRFKKAINLAITANPGGVKSTVSLPQDTVPQGSYDQDKTVYFKSFKVA